MGKLISTGEVQRRAALWEFYNTRRIHSALRYKTPDEVFSALAILQIEIILKLERLHRSFSITEALRLTKNKRCKRCCPNGIDFEVIIVDGKSIIYDKNVSKNFPTLEMLGNLKLNFPCR